MTDFPDLSKAWESLRDAAEAYASDAAQAEHENWLDKMDELYNETFFKLEKDDPRRLDDEHRYAVNIIHKYQSTKSPIYRDLMIQLLNEKAVAFGRLEKKSSPFAKVPSEYWRDEALIPNKYPDKAWWPGPPERVVFQVRIIDSSQIDKVKNPRGAGRPRKHNWDTAIDHLLIHVASNGIPKTKNDLLRFVENEFRKLGVDIEDSSITSHFSSNLPHFFSKCNGKPDK